jgi:hypothetical protein
VPAEVALTERAHSVLDGWPGATPFDLAENLMAVLKDELASETDPTQRGRLERLIEGVSKATATSPAAVS